jgi:hypothetical protein
VVTTSDVLPAYSGIDWSVSHSVLRNASFLFAASR